jgi:hypothetical protein
VPVLLSLHISVTIFWLVQVSDSASVMLVHRKNHLGQALCCVDICVAQSTDMASIGLPFQAAFHIRYC